MSAAGGAGRVPVKTLTFSAMALMALVAFEGFSPTAYIPTKGDVPTIGHGSTVWPDGSPVQIGQTITKERALVVAKAHINKDERAFRASVEGVTFHQYEYDAFLDFAYQYGMSNWRQSSMRRLLLVGDYQGACDALLKWRFAAGYDCSTPGNRRCYGVWQRQRERVQTCLGH